MAEATIEQSVASIDKFLAEAKAKARAISEREKASAEGFAKEWEDLYATVPEGRMRAFTEVVGIKAARDSSVQRRADISGELIRFSHEAGALPSPEV